MFLDSSGLLCLIHLREPLHENAVSSYDAATTPRLTHSYVLDEFIELAQSRKLSRGAALDFRERLTLSSRYFSPPRAASFSARSNCSSTPRRRFATFVSTT